MKIGIISDIHNNLPALEAVLARLEDCDRIVCCGDIIGIGPFPDETVRRVMAIPHLWAVQGNHDRYFAEGLPASIPNDKGMEEGEMGMHRWEHARLSAKSADFLRGLPLSADFEAGGLRIAVQHYCMDEHRRYVNFTPSPSAEALDAMFAGMQADIILYGHDHASCVQASGHALYINPGSLGCPGREGDLARAGILTVRDGHAQYAPLEVRYAVQPVIAAIDRAAYPDFQPVKKYFFGID